MMRFHSGFLKSVYSPPWWRVGVSQPPRRDAGPGAMKSKSSIATRLRGVTVGVDKHAAGRNPDPVSIEAFAGGAVEPAPDDNAVGCTAFRLPSPGFGRDGRALCGGTGRNFVAAAALAFVAEVTRAECGRVGCAAETKSLNCSGGGKFRRLLGVSCLFPMVARSSPVAAWTMAQPLRPSAALASLVSRGVALEGSATHQRLRARVPAILARQSKYAA
jgi:hypothetical protein